MKKDLYKIITDKIIEKLEQGTLPWQKPFLNGNTPCNITTPDKPYQGINKWFLSSLDFDCPWYATFNQVKKLGGSVKKNSKSVPVVYWNFIEKENTQTGETETIPFIRNWNVFNLSDTTLEIPKTETKENKSIHEIEQFILGYLNKQKIAFSHANCIPHYNILSDTIKMPTLQQATSEENYYSTIFHEIGHSTGHAKRLNRALENSRNSKGYAIEELIAELTASNLCHFHNLEKATLDNSASYIQSWLQALRNDKRFIISASSKAEQATKFILDNTEQSI